MKVLIALFAILAACAATSYDGFKVLRVTPGSQDALEKLQIILNSPEVTLWKEHRGHPATFDVMVTPTFYPTFIRELEKQIHTGAYKLIDDVQELIEEQMKENEIAKRNAKSGESRIDNTYYRNLDEIYAELDGFAAANPTFMSVIRFGSTVEGRDLRVMKVSTGGADTRKIVWIDCGIHAREWITPASCLYYLDQLSTYGTDPAITALLDTYDFYVLSVFNPDGYAYTWSDDRMWRKNRNTQGGLCFGTDLNRNFGTGWGGPGASDQPCSDLYHGPTAFSELESIAVRDYLLTLQGRLYQYYNMHSYYQLWMYSNGYTATPTPDDAEQNRVAKAGVDALTAVYGTPFQYGPISTTIYLASGGTVDWVYDPVGVVYSYTLEMRDTGRYGFLLPPDQIEPVGIESWAGVVAAVNAGNP